MERKAVVARMVVAAAAALVAGGAEAVARAWVAEAMETVVRVAATAEVTKEMAAVIRATAAMWEAASVVERV